MTESFAARNRTASRDISLPHKVIPIGPSPWDHPTPGTGNMPQETSTFGDLKSSSFSSFNLCLLTNKISNYDERQASKDNVVCRDRSNTELEGGQEELQDTSSCSSHCPGHQPCRQGQPLTLFPVIHTEANCGASL